MPEQLVSSGVDLSSYLTTRAYSRQLCETLHPEDCVLQSMPDASPVRWHLAHTTWFFETFLLKRQAGYETVNPAFDVLFNSYYNTVGSQFPRDQRGLLSRPTVSEVWQYRDEVDLRMETLLSNSNYDSSVLVTGIQHEQQHQELLLTDIKHAFSLNPIEPVFRKPPPGESSQSAARTSLIDEWMRFDSESIVEIGSNGDTFCFDNELPRHRRLLPSFQIQSDLVTCRQYLEFIDDGGYRRPEFWLSAGWATVQQNDWTCPLYWRRRGSKWSQFTLRGRLPLNLDQPVTHVSYFEADAYARWSGARLPTEYEWEHAVASDRPAQHRLADQRRTLGDSMHPGEAIQNVDSKLRSVFGSLWQWTSSGYDAYPGYRPPPGAIGEYNGKFMCGQYVLRGGSCATPPGHARHTYRNFFPPHVRWQFAGIRLARQS